jgi:cephalosporin hydroxylase
MNTFEEKYNYLCREKSDINEHLPILYACASKCESVLETGVRGGVSTWAFAHGLCNNGKQKKHLFLNDVTPCDISELTEAIKNTGINLEYEWENNLKLNLKTSFDVVFIDTWHVYGQLKRELEKFSAYANKYIMLHDTTIDAEIGETIRNYWNADAQSKQTGIPVEEITKGVWPAVEEFVNSHTNWEILFRLSNNNGLTVLKKVK